MGKPADSTAALAAFFEGGRQFTYDRNEVIIRAGDNPSGVYFITAGWVKLYSLCEDGEVNIIMSLGAGDVFPLAWALTGITRDVTFGALEDTQVLRISREAFLEAASANLVASQAVSTALADYFFRLADELENLHYRSARERVAFRLLCLAEYFGHPEGEHVKLDIRIPNEYIARSTNMTRETASRVISRFAQKELVRNIDGYLTITDLVALRHEAGKDFFISDGPAGPDWVVP